MDERNRQAKAAVLERIRGTLNPFLLQSNTVRESQREQEFAKIPREFLKAGDLSDADRIGLFRDRLAYYGATSETAAPGNVAGVVAEMLRKRSKQRIVVPEAFPQEWRPIGFELLDGNGLSNTDLDGVDGVLTGCTVAIALTGTIVLASRGDNGRRAVTLVPDYQLCVVRDKQIFELFPESLQALWEYKRLPLTFFSGPSATVDIEMTRVKGVHGPRTLDVVIVTSS